MTWKIPLFRMYWDEDDIMLVNEAIRSGMSWAAGPKVAEFEQDIAAFIGSRYCLAFNSGTSATHAALLAHGVGSGDEVIVPSFTFISTANVPQFVGAKPVFADIEEKTLGLNPDDVLEKISPHTKAIIPVHYGGCPCDIPALRDIADDHNLILIEDAAESFGARISNRKVGTYGDSAMFSFCQNKIITTGEGGAIVTESRDLFEKMKLIRSHGRLETSDYFSTSAVMDYIALGYNFRISTITAALGVAQMKKVEKIIQLRRDDAAYYIKKLHAQAGEVTPMKIPRGYHPVYQLFSVFAKERDTLIKYLDEQGIMTKIYFSPVHMTDFYKNTLGYRCILPVTEKISRNIISLPFFPGLSHEEIDTVVNSIKTFYGTAR